MNRERYLFVVNPIAGGTNKNKLKEEIKRICTEKTLRHSLFETTGEDDEALIREDIKTFKPDVVVVAGGDGTVNMVSHLLVNTDMLLGILPQGSGNGLAKDLQIPLDEMEALKTIFKGHVMDIDTLMVNGHPCFHISDIGFNAVVVQAFSQKKFRGQLAYGIALLQKFFKYKSKQYTISTGSITYQDKAFLVAIANAKQFGSNTTINPIGELNDGQFEIAILKSFSWVEGIAIFYRLWKGDIHLSRYSQLIRCQEAVIENLDNEVMQVDGEIVPSSPRVEVKMYPNSLKIIVPERQ